MATRERMTRGRQVVFGPMQRHSQTFELGFIIFCLLCIVVAVIIAKATDWGVTTRP
ncbi:MAG TPA: hypothetical protein VN960_11670 [Gaiellaceae bacterium]|jgi:hypothetical protein|nr:hypothetical protein [Gaiellaceae bacterium]